MNLSVILLYLLGTACVAFGADPASASAQTRPTRGDAFPDPFILSTADARLPIRATERVSKAMEPLSGDTVPVRFRYVPGRFHRLEGGSGSILVQTTINTPVPCYTLQSVATRDGTNITLRVVARRRPIGCIADAGWFEYQAVLEQLPPGTYRVRLIHEYPDARDRWSGPVLEGPVTVH